MTDVLGYKAVLSNPYLTKAIIPSKKKTDKIDAKIPSRSLTWRMDV